MRKYTFLWSAIIIFVLLLVLAFENIWLVQQYFVLFWSFNASTTIVILFGGILGFLVGFFSMLYSFELRKEKEMAEEADTMGTAPSEQIETAPETSDEKDKEDVNADADSPIPEASKPDEFDEDDEVLG